MIGAKVEYQRLTAIVELNSADGWVARDGSQTLRAIVEKVEATALDVYTLIVDEVNIGDAVSPTDNVIFSFEKALLDTATTADPITFDFSKVMPDDSVAASDSIIFQFDMSLSDTATPTDSAVFNMEKILPDDVATATDSVVFNLTSEGSGAINDTVINGNVINGDVINIKVF